MSAATYDVLILILIFALVTLGLDLIVGYTKIFSINQALLFGVGAFSYAYCVNHLHTASLFAAWAIAVPITAVLSAAIGLASLRVKGDYFIVASFGAQIIGLQVLFNWDTVSGGSQGTFGLPSPSVLGWTPSGQPEFLYLVVAVAAVVYLAATFLLRSPWGRLVRALGEDEAALAAAGFDPRRLQVVAFVLGGSLAAIAGPLYAGYVGIAQVADFELAISISLLAMVILGGAGRVAGGLLGAAVFVLIPHFLDQTSLSSTASAQIKQAIFGTLLLAIVMFVPAGLTGLIPSLGGLGRGRALRGAEPAAGLQGAQDASHPLDGVTHDA